MSTLRAMADATAPLVRAIEAVVAGHDLTPADIDALLPALRAAPPACYPAAATDDVDVATLAEVLRRHPHVLGGDGAVEIDVDAIQTDPRGLPRAARAARAVVDATVLALEARKLAFGLMAKPAALKAIWSSPDDARATLLAVRGLEGLIGVTSSTVLAQAPTWSPALPSDREVHVVAGAGARRVLDVLAPSVRRLRVELALAGRRGAVVDDDDVYRGLVRLHQSDPATVDERRAADADEGVIEVDGGAGFVVDAAALVEDLVDRRARGLVLPLKRARVVIVGVVDPDDLFGVLVALARDGSVVRSLQLLVPATAGDHADADGEPGAVVDAASGHVWPGSVATATLSVPWLGLVPPGVRADAGAFTLLQAAAAARLDGALAVTSVLTRVADDESATALSALAAMAPVPGR